MSGSVTVNVSRIEEILRVKDLKELERLTGRTFHSMMSSGGMSADEICVLLYLVRRKTEPDITIAQCEEMTLAETAAVLNPPQAPLGKLAANGITPS